MVARPAANGSRTSSQAALNAWWVIGASQYRGMLRLMSLPKATDSGARAGRRLSRAPSVNRPSRTY